MKKAIPIIMFFGAITVWFSLFVLQMINPTIEKLDKSGLNKLKGAFTLEKDTSFSLKAWHDGVYQSKKTLFANDNYYLRPIFTKLSNQYNYQFFGKHSAKEIYRCKEGYLFRFYVDEFKPSTNFKGRNHIDSITTKISLLQAKLDSHGVKLLQIINPDKARICSKYLCDRFKENESNHPNNYRTYLNVFEERKINYIDFNHWFTLIKDTVSIPLFAKNGVHWTQSASSYAIDSIQDYMENSLKRELPSLVRFDKHYQLNPWKPDIDAFEIMNLLWPANELELPYFSYAVDNESLKNKPKVLVISDSFWDAPSWTGLDSLLWDNQEYWYYNKTYRDYKSPERPINETDYDRLTEYDFIIVMATEMNLGDIGWGFYDSAIKSLKKTK